MKQFATDKGYKAWLHSKQWQNLRQSYMTDHPWCEDCLLMHRRTPATDCHHKNPVLSYPTLTEQRFMMFNPNNLAALCPTCHKRRHDRREQKQHRAERAEDKRKAFIEKYKSPPAPTGGALKDSLIPPISDKQKSPIHR